MKIKTYRHGGPYDRGSADAFYGRSKSPHYFVAGSYSSPLVTADKMTDKQINDYLKGYEEQTERKYS
jgi:hypothetical protein